jgi:hypothetical protein
MCVKINSMILRWLDVNNFLWKGQIQYKKENTDMPYELNIIQ